MSGKSSQRGLLEKALSRILNIVDRREYEIEILNSRHIAEKKSDTLCLFAHFDSNDIIDDYVVNYIRKLKGMRIDIIFVSTSSLEEREISKIEQYCSDVIVRNNVGYDFGSWKTALRYSGDSLEKYDKLILCNDSVYAPLNNLKPIFDKMDENFDFWGITDNLELGYHIQSYFMVFNRKIIESSEFQSFWRNFKAYGTKKRIIRKYELGLSKLLKSSGFRLGAYIPFDAFSHTKPRNNTIHFFREMIEEYSSPIIKIELLRDNPADIDISDWESVVKENTDYDIDLIKQHLKRIKN